RCRGGQGPARASVGAWTERLCVRLGERPFRAAMEDGALRLRDGVRAMTLSDRFWRGVTVVVRLDMAAGIAIAAGLLLWLTWHGHDQAHRRRQRDRRPAGLHAAAGVRGRGRGDPALLLP